MHPTPLFHPLERRVFSLFALLLLVTASGAFFRLGVATWVWAALYVITAYFILRQPIVWLDALAKAWPLLAFPLFCLLSVLWSEAPEATTRHAFQYLMTFFMAVLLGKYLHVHKLTALLCGATMICIVVSVLGTALGLIDGYIQQDYVGAERYFVGLYTQKNMLGIVIALGAMAAVGIGLIYQQKLLSAVVAAMLILAAIESKSTTALILCIFALSAYPVWWLAHNRTRTTVGLVAFLVLACGTTIALLAFQIPAFEQVITALGKEHTLTGRTVIWESAFESASERPFLGVGYQAFWEATPFANQVMHIHAAVLDSIQGFHNGYLEALVATGLVGLLFYLMMLGTALFTALRAFSKGGSESALAALAIIVLILGRSLTESIGYFQHDLEILLICAYCISLQQHPEDAAYRWPHPALRLMPRREVAA